ncbi:MAG: DNA methyltransferase, partial [bacterium]
VFKRKYIDIMRWLTDPGSYCNNSFVIISTQSATDLSQIPDSSIDYCFTDPPYGANINYSELNFLWEAWLGHFTKIDEEAVINPVQKKGLDEYKELMEKSFKEIFRVLKPGRYLSLTFHNSQTAVWNAIQSALSNAGFNLAYIGVFDKMQRTFNQVTTQKAVGYDVLLHAYKPRISNGVRRKREITIEEVIDWLEEKFKKLPQTKNEEREGRKLHSELIGWCLTQGIPLGDLERLGLRDFGNFLQLLNDNFNDIDGYYFLPGQIPPISQSVLPGEFGTIKDVQSALNWLWDFLSEPKSYEEVLSNFLKALAGQKLERTLEDLLDENFVYTDEGKWRVPTAEELEGWGKIKRAKQVRKFENWWRRFKRGEAKVLPPDEIMKVGLREWYQKGKHWWMVELKELLRRKGILKDCSFTARTLMEMAEREVRGNA